MIRKLFIFLLPILAVVIVAVSLLGHSLPHADFTYVLGDSVRTLDPARMSWSNDIRIALGLWEGLTAFDPRTITPVPGVAYLPPDVTDDGLTYTFQLRPEARWSNGDPVDAGDFIFAWRRAIEPGAAGDYRFLITDNIAGAADYAAWRDRAVRTLTLLDDLQRNESITDDDRAFLKHQNLLPSDNYVAAAAQFRNRHLAQMDPCFAQVGLTALDDHTLQVTLARPVSYFLDLLAFSTFLPIHRSVELLRVNDNPKVTDLTLWVYDPQWVKPDYHHNDYPGLISNGAYRLDEWRFKRYMLFARNEQYWDRAAVQSSSIMARVITEANTAFLAYQRGEVDWLNDLTRLEFAPQLIDQARTGSRDDIHITPAFGVYFYDFNCQPALPDGTPNPLVDPRLRLALTCAVDRQAIVKNVTRLGNAPAYNFTPPNSIDGYACPPGPGFDPQRAATLLAEAGYPQGEGLPTIEILYNTGYGHDLPAQAVAEMWRTNLGLKVSLRGMEVKSFAEKKQTHQFMVCRAGWFGDYGDPTTFLDRFVTGNGNNDSAFSYEPYDRLMQQAAQTRDPQRRMEILADAESIIVNQQAPMLPLYYYVNLLAFRPDVKGLHPNPRNMHPLKHIHIK